MEYRCQLCDFQSSHESVLSLHVDTTHVEPVNQLDKNNETCTPSECVFKKPADLPQQFKYRCKLCNYKTNRNYALNTHNKLIHENLRIPCPYCHYTTTRKKYLKNHIKFVHN